MKYLSRILSTRYCARCLGCKAQDISCSKETFPMLRILKMYVGRIWLLCVCGNIRFLSCGTGGYGTGLAEGRQAFCH